MPRAQIQACLQLIGALLLYELQKCIEKGQKKKRTWVRRWINRRVSHGASITLLKELAEEDHVAYRNHLRMDPDKFNELLENIEPHISKKDTVMRMAIPSRTKLEITLRYLATGDSFKSLQYLYRVPANTISCFLPEILSAIFHCLSSYIKVPGTETEWEEIQNTFMTRWNFPNCCGAIDGKHVHIKRPRKSGSEFYNYKGTYSIILFALVDGDYCFRYIDVGGNGRASDSSIFRESTLNILMEKNQLRLPINSVIVGDDAFPLTTNLLKPYSRVNLTLQQRVFNYRLSRARRVVENAFGILASRFRVFSRPIELKVQTVDLIVKASCVLHNWLRMTSTKHYFPSGCVDIEDHNIGEVIPGSWRNEVKELSTVIRAGSNNYSNTASLLRDQYAKYFVEEGAVSWQYKMIGFEDEV